MKKKRHMVLIVAVAAMLIVPIVAIAADRFDDVPTTNVFHDDIGWLADAGITLGCNPPANDEFCPDDSVKRQQMAAFLRRFANYIGAEDGTPAQADNATTADSATTAGDADTLEGYTAAQLSPVVAGANFEVDAVGGGLFGETIAEVTIAAPADGVLVMSATGDTWAGTGAIWCAFELDGGGTFLPGIWAGYVDHAQDSEADCVTSGIAEVTAGDHTVGLVYSGDSMYFGQMSVVWYPHGSLDIAATTVSASNRK